MYIKHITKGRNHVSTIMSIYDLNYRQKTHAILNKVFLIQLIINLTYVGYMDLKYTTLILVVGMYVCVTSLCRLAKLLTSHLMFVQRKPILIME